MSEAPPANVPTGAFILPTASPAVTTPDEQLQAAAETNDVKAIEDRAHAHRALLSSDAIRELVNTTPRGTTQLAYLEEIVALAKVSYPTEDGWVVINTARIHELIHKLQQQTTSTPPVVEPVAAESLQSDDDVPVGAGSLAEAMLSGNVAAAYQLIGHRPMVALADASADLDALYRQKQGHPAVVSELLTRQAETLDPEKIKDAITALTSALDGVYTSEAEAVKMAIMKAIKAIS